MRSVCRNLCRARAEIALRAVRELGYSGDNVARYLGVTTSCINRVVGAVRGREKGDGRWKMEAKENFLASGGCPWATGVFLKQ